MIFTIYFCLLHIPVETTVSGRGLFQVVFSLFLVKDVLMFCSYKYNRRADVIGPYDICEDGTTDSCWQVSQAFSRLLDFSLPVVTAVFVGDVYGEYTSRVCQKVLINRVHSGHQQIADNVERNQPGVTTTLVYSKQILHIPVETILRGGCLIVYCSFLIKTCCYAIQNRRGCYVAARYLREDGLLDSFERFTSMFSSVGYFPSRRRQFILRDVIIY